MASSTRIGYEKTRLPGYGKGDRLKCNVIIEKSVRTLLRPLAFHRATIFVFGITDTFHVVPYCLLSRLVIVRVFVGRRKFLVPTVGVLLR